MIVEVVCKAGEVDAYTYRIKDDALDGVLTPCPYHRFFSWTPAHQLKKVIVMIPIQAWSFSCPGMHLRTLRSPPPVATRETPRKGCPGGREDARGAVWYTSQVRMEHGTAEDSPTSP